MTDASFDFNSNIIKQIKTHLYGKHSNVMFIYKLQKIIIICSMIVHLKSRNIGIESILLNFNST